MKTLALQTVSLVRTYDQQLTRQNRQKGGSAGGRGSLWVSSQLAKIHLKTGRKGAQQVVGVAYG